ncbi:MAG: YggS family pyridoxal phosphate-dependent enzyme [Gammaproteobacteria bacterium]|nr:YggS family pyridoxal phosphate-dependent enzyme [Gammaproteobacteria bacterium]
MDISDNLYKLRDQIFVLEGRHCGRQGSVRLLAVSKTKSIAEIEEAIHVGQYFFGENYVQEAIEKIQALTKYSNLEWHYIGRVQKNKVRSLAQYFDWVQTIETKEVAEKLNQACEKINRKINICLQVNIGCEPQKNGVLLIENVGAAGWSPLEVLAKHIVEKCPFLCLRGLMAIGLDTQDQKLLKQMFSQLRSCYDVLKKQYATVDTLSMGMSSDMALAIACGSTMVRIGTAIFGERRK